MPEDETQPEKDERGVYERDGNLYRDIEIPAQDGTTYIQTRSVARTLEEAKAKKWDFWFSDELGWYIKGFKWEKDRDVESIMADNSMGRPGPV
ncbi:hypothetical protein LCGC14_1181400 [marine sediment metagenome]|uniref:Uncharacterized protein n=1 Tax=marine sediment metagenome TaxID=412755 RepID=A0A0F9P4X9_9ZZZZ